GIGTEISESCGVWWGAGGALGGGAACVAGRGRLVAPEPDARRRPHPTAHHKTSQEPAPPQTTRRHKNPHSMASVLRRPSPTLGVFHGLPPPAQARGALVGIPARLEAALCFPLARKLL